MVPEGLWIAEQKESGRAAANYHIPEPKDLSEAAWLVDWNGKLLKTVTTPSRNTSGMAVGGGYVWMGANARSRGSLPGGHEFQTRSAIVRSRSVPADNGGGCHGLFWHEGKLWIASLRLKGILRVDPTTWEPEFFIPFYAVEGRPRYHGIAWDDGTIWLVTGNDSHSYSEGRAGLVRYDASSGKVLETADFAPGSCDPHGLAMHDGCAGQLRCRPSPRLAAQRQPHQRLDLQDRVSLTRSIQRSGSAALRQQVPTLINPSCDLRGGQ